MRFWKVLLLLQAAAGYKFLIHSPLFGHSHATFLAHIADLLTAAGHDVTFFVPIMDEELVGKKTVSLTKDVITMEASPEVRKLYNFIRKAMYATVWETTPDPTELMAWARNFSVAWELTCKHILKHDSVLETLRDRKYDVAIAEPLSICGFAIFHHLGIPGTIGAISTTQADAVSYSIGEPIAPSYVPALTSATDEKLGFIGRIKNLFDTFVGFYFVGKMYEGEIVELKKKFGSNFTSVDDLLAATSFMFTNSQPYLNFPRPLIHKTVEIGGISVDLKRIDKLEEKWNKILNERDYTVFISFGSVAKSKDMPEEFKKSILKMCHSMPDVTFIWKYEEPSEMAADIPNLHLFPWLPQSGLLADKRLSLFITHGGLGSTTEVAHLGKAAIMIPLFAEQHRNSHMLSKHGGALVMDKKDIGNTDAFRENVLKVLNDPTYEQNAKRLSRLLQERPISARDLAVSHAEFVAKFGRLPNLDPYGRRLSLIEYYFVDIMAAVGLLLGTALLSLVLYVKWLIRKCSGPSKLKTQ